MYDTGQERTSSDQKILIILVGVIGDGGLPVIVWSNGNGTPAYVL
jgi:hypothetical protein